MERRRDERISVSLKAALLNDRTLPRGCRVRDFSQRGMLLQYDYDGNDSGLDDGDTVAVRLSLRQADERKVVTLPATVRRVEQNGIGVEFEQPEARLLELLEPWRLDRPQLQEADRTSIGHGDTARTVTRLIRPRPRHRGSAGRAAPSVLGAAGQADRTPADGAARTPAAGPVPEPDAAALTDRRLFYVGLVALVCAILVLILDFGDSARLKHRLSALEAGNRNHAAALSEMRDRFAAVSEPGQALADLSARLDTLTVSVAALDGKLAAASPGATLETAALENCNDASATHEPVPAPAPQPAATAAAVRDVEAILDAPAAARNGPWVINLVSLFDKAAADRFVAAAESKGVRVTENRVTVKGREVWRLQIGGFATQQDARAYGATVSEKLGLKDVWVFKR
jgi:septal ring-binding cell division protein DamX